MYEIRSTKDGVAGAYEYSTSVPADYSFKQMLDMARDIANENGYEASIYDDENEMVITISPKQYSMGVAARAAENSSASRKSPASTPSREPIASKSPAYWAGVWSSARTWD